MHQQQVIEQLLAGSSRAGSAADAGRHCRQVRLLQVAFAADVQATYRPYSRHLRPPQKADRRRARTAPDRHQRGLHRRYLPVRFAADLHPLLPQTVRSAAGQLSPQRDWSSYGLQPPLRLTETIVAAGRHRDAARHAAGGQHPAPQFYAGAAGGLKCELRRHAWRQLLQPQALPEVVYGLTSLEVDRQRRGNPRMAYTAALPDEGAMGERVTIEQGSMPVSPIKGRRKGYKTLSCGCTTPRCRR